MLLSQFPQDFAGEFAQERARLLSALRHMTEGGIIELVEHLGATSMPGAPAGSTIDIALSIWPFPVDADSRAVLQALGYERLLDLDGTAPERWSHTAGTFQLFFFEAGSASWTDYRLASEYLRSHEEARLGYLARKQAWAAANDEQAKRHFFLGLCDEARLWWAAQQGWTPVEFVSSELSGFKSPWYISGGWALDLYQARVRRVHEDVDVVFPRTDQLALQAYMAARGWRWLAPADGRMEPWPTQKYLDSSHHQVHAHREGKFIDFLLTEMDRDVWHYRRDRSVVRATERAGLTSSGGIPYLAPELVLLFKSKNTSGRERTKDETDFQEILPHLEVERRAWLYWALTATQPDHPWIDQIRMSRTSGK